MDEARDLVAVEGELAEAEGQLVDDAAHLGPDGLRNDAGHGLAGFAGDVADADAVEELAVAVHVLGDDVEQHDRDGERAALDVAGLALHAAQLGQEVLHVGLADHALALFRRDGLEGALGLRQAADVDGVHSGRSPFLMFGRRLCGPFLGCRRFFGLFGLELPAQLFDFALQRGHRFGVGAALGLKAVDLGVHGVALFVGLDLGDRRFQLRLAGLDLGVLLAECCELRLFALDLAPQHDGF